MNIAITITRLQREKHSVEEKSLFLRLRVFLAIVCIYQLLLVLMCIYNLSCVFIIYYVHFLEFNHIEALLFVLSVIIFA